MRRIAARAGGSTDTSSDHEYTDWNQVREVAADLVTVLGGPVPSAAGPRMQHVG